MTPYTTKSGLQIGLLYPDRPRPYHDPDALHLQDALLNKRSGGLLERIASFFWRLA